jgi:hypothetical protein
MTVHDMKTIALDTLDIQARASLSDMILMIKRLARHKLTPVDFESNETR